MLLNQTLFVFQSAGYLISVFDADTMIRVGGLLVILLAVYAQTGLFFCFFVPSGVFIFTGGMFVATGQLHCNIVSVASLLIVVCIAGCLTGYWFGMKAGVILYHRKSRFFKQKHLKAAEGFYSKYGQMALTYGILFPITRTFAPIVAGIIRMNLARFLFLVFVGSSAWILLFVFAGYMVGSIDGLREYAGYLVAFVIIAVTIPVVTKIIREYKRYG